MIGRNAARLGSVLMLLGSATSAAASSACNEGGRGTDVIAISGDRFPSLAGSNEEALSAWAWRGGLRIAVPFQVDECDSDGRVIVGTAAGPAPAAKLGTNAVLLLRRHDGGDPAPKKSGNGAFAVKVDDSAKTPRWIYVGAADHELPRSPIDEVDYDPGRDRIQADRYTLAFERPQIGYFAVADGKGKDGPNLIDRLKARVTAKVLWGLVSFHRNEDQVKETVLGYRDGPLRVARRTELEVALGLGLPVLRFVSEDYFYDDHAEGPVMISLPFSLAYVFGDLDVRIYLDFRELEGYELLAEGLGARTLRVGEGSAPTLPPTRSTWFALRRDGKGFLHRLHLGHGLESVESTLYYGYDPALAEPPESVVGERPAVGYRLTGWQGVTRGRYELLMDTYILDGAGAADPWRAIAALDRPPGFAVTEAGR